MATTSSSGRDLILQNLHSATRPELLRLVSEWADENRVLDSKTSGEQGPWRTERFPHLKAIMDALSTLHRCKIVVFIKCTQIGGTEAALNWLGYIIDHSPSPVLIVQPTIALVERFSRQRIDSMLQTTPRLAGKVREAKERDGANTVKMKEFDGGIMILAGANSAASLQSMPSARAIMDEVDDYPRAVGKGDGDISPIASVLERQQNFPRRKTFITSTPLDKATSHVTEWYEKSNMCQYWVPCPLDGCGKFQVLVWKQLRWPKGEPKKAYYVCEHCGGAIQNRQKAQMLPRGEWRPERETDGEIEGFKITGLYRPVGKRPWGTMAQMFTDAGHDPVKLKAFWTKEMAEAYDEGALTRPDPTGLAMRCQPWGVHAADKDDSRATPAIPPGVQVLVMGVDVQADRIEAQLVGFGRGQESWVCGYWILRGDVQGQDVWADLDALRHRDFVDWQGEVRQIAATCIDSGFESMRVYQYVKERQRVYAIKGDGDESGRARDIWPRKPSKSKGKSDLYVIGVDTAKTGIYGRLRLKDSGPGYIHFGHGLPDDYFDQLTCEWRKVIKTDNGRVRRVWHKQAGARNEALDTMVYAWAALHAWIARGHRLDAKVRDAPKKPGVDGKPAPPQTAVQSRAATPPPRPPGQSGASMGIRGGLGIRGRD